MAPYIAALIILIVVILFMVYKRVDGFEIQTVSYTKNTKVQDLYNLTLAHFKQNKDTRRLLETLGEFEEKNPTATLLNDIGVNFSKDDTTGKLNLFENPISKALKSALDRTITQQEGEVDKMKKDVESGSVKLDQTLEEMSKAHGLNYEMLNAYINGMIQMSNKREKYVKSKVPSSATTVAGMNSQDLFDAVRGSGTAVKASTMDNSGNELLTGAAPETTPGFTKEVENRIAKSVATQVKDMMLSQRSTSNGMEDQGCPYAPYESNSTAQGKEYSHVNPTQPAPDMSEYIRKDSIPCWNCTLP
jgi:hypothetical protein